MGTAQHARVLLPAVTLLLASALISLAVPPDATSLFPAGGALGETVEVTATGTFANWPVQTWCNDPRIQIECAKDKGKLQIRIAADAATGIAWVRFFDGEGASSPRPFVIASLPSVREKEPNDSTKQAQQIAVPAVVHGKYDKNGDADVYRIELAAGQTVVASLQSNNILGSPADPALQICNEQGQVLAVNQDADGIDSLLVYRAEAAGIYLVRTFALPATPNSSINFAGGELFIYRLTLTAGPFANHTFPLAVSREGQTELKLQGWHVPAEAFPVSAPPSSASMPWYWSPPNAAGLVPLRVSDVPFLIASESANSADGQTIETPRCITGVIAKAKEVHRFKFAGKKGVKLAIAAEANNLGFDLDPLLKLTGPDGKLVTEADDMGKSADPTLNATLAADGEYVLEIRDLHRSGGPRHVYRLTIEEPQPKVTLSVAAGNYLVEAGKMVEIPVTIGRQNGFNDEIKVTAVDLPEGVSVIFGTSQAKGDSSKQVKLILNATADAKAGPIRIVATIEEEKELAIATYSQTLGGSTFQHTNLWLGVKGTK